MIYSRENPSPRYLELIEVYRRMHREGLPALGVSASEMFPGYSIWPHVTRIRDLVKDFGAKTILDYGSGKGTQYQATHFKLPGMSSPISSLHDYWGVAPVRCYDPCYEPFARLPAETADGVISTDMLEHCPEDDIDWIIDELFSYARKFVFASIAAFAAEKTLANGENAHCTIRPFEWWHEKMEIAAAKRRDVKYLIVVVAREGSAGAYTYSARYAKNTRGLTERKDGATQCL